MNDCERDSLTTKTAPVRGRVLLCEEDDLFRELLGWSLRREHYEVTTCSDGSGLASSLASCLLFGEPPGFDVVVSGLSLRGPTALDVLEAMYGCGGLPPVLLLTGSQDVDTREARRLGVTALLRDPFDIEELLTRVETLVGAYAEPCPRPAHASAPRGAAMSAS